MNTSSTVELAKALLSISSITPLDKGCQLLIAKRLAALGFNIEHLRFGEVDNLWARLGTEAPLFVFAGHTDVVPPGPLSEWESSPFTPTPKGDYLFARGAADMKGSLAAMVTACESFLQASPTFKGSIAFLITSDEEGPAKDGTKRVLEVLQERGITIDYCLVGEPSSEEILGDVMKVGRRGSLSGHLKVFGQQQHIAYATHEDNLIHQSLAALTALSTLSWEYDEIRTKEKQEIAISEKNTDTFPKTSFHISNVHAGTHAGNIVPGILECQFNFRFSPKLTPEHIQEKVETLFNSHQLAYELRWELFGLPFLTNDGMLRQTASKVIHEVLGIHPQSSTSGGTSDARFIAQTGAQVIEFGPSRKTIHSINECVKTTDLDKLSVVYEKILSKIYD